MNWLQMMLQMSLSGAVLILLIALLRRVTLHVLPKRAFLLFWAVAVLRLLVPFAPVLRIPLPLPPAAQVVWTERDPASEQPSALTETAQTPGEVQPFAAGRGEREPAGATQNQIDLQTQPTLPDAPSALTRTAGSAEQIIQIVWAAGAGLLGAFFAGSYVAGYRKFGAARPVDHPAARRWLETHPFKRTVAIRALPGLASPLTYGVFRPVILAPASAAFWAGEGAYLALEHEYFHIRRFDTVKKPLLALVLTVHWFNPAVWLLFFLCNRDMELACDEAVLRRLGEGVRRAYAHTLLSAGTATGDWPPLPARFGANSTRERIVEIMRFQKTSVLSLLLAALLLLATAACAAIGATSQSSEPPADPSSTASALQTPASSASPEGVVFQNGGLKLPIPEAYADLVIVETPENHPEGFLFSVTEKASREAGEKDHPGENWGEGWLFGILPVDETEFLRAARLHDQLIGLPFAKDESGTYYLAQYPTDDRFYREGAAVTPAHAADWEQWVTLNTWRAGEMHAAFIQANSGLSPVTEVDMVLTLLASSEKSDQSYTISSTDYGPLEAKGVDKTPYLARLLDGVTFRQVEENETPDGEYLVLDLPWANARLDFFRDDGNYIRVTRHLSESALFRAEYEDGETRACNIVAEWYHEMVKKR